MTGAVAIGFFERALPGDRPARPTPTAVVEDTRAAAVAELLVRLTDPLGRERSLAPVLEAVGTGQPGVTQLYEDFNAVVIPASDVLVVYESFIEDRRTDIPLTPFLGLMDQWVEYVRRPSPRGTQTVLLPWPWEGRFRRDRLAVMLCGYIGPEDRAPGLLGAPPLLDRFVEAAYPDLTGIADRLERSLDIVIDGTWTLRRTAPDRFQIREHTDDQHTDDQDTDGALTVLFETLRQLAEAIAGPYPFDGDAAAEVPWLPDQW